MTQAELSPGEYVQIDVKDTGSGMTPEVLRRAFEPFFTTKPIGQGTGLGLSMVYGFAQQSKGHVAIDSTVGTGTTIKLYLPRYLAAEDGEDTPDGRGETPRGAGEPVLLVEDDPSVRQLIVEVLRELGYTAVEAKNAEEAIAILRSEQGLDLMISDVGLPGLSGRQLAEIARESRPACISCHDRLCRRCGPPPGLPGPRMDLMLKPFSMDAIAVKIRSIIEARG